jgi:hypothetical protein
VIGLTRRPDATAPAGAGRRQVTDHRLVSLSSGIATGQTTYPVTRAKASTISAASTFKPWLTIWTTTFDPARFPGNVVAIR